jgi:predicted PurR-regulated permease PerM
VAPALLLGAATFLLSVVPFGAPLVSIGVAVWLFNQDSIGWAVFTLVWGVLLMPFVLVLLGVFGGVLAFGFIGLFLGLTLLAVGYSLTRKWVGVEARAARTKL